MIFSKEPVMTRLSWINVSVGFATMEIKTSPSFNPVIALATFPVYIMSVFEGIYIIY